MEDEITEKKLIGEAQREALVYSLDIIRVALLNGWRIKIFQTDYRLSYLEGVLHDIGIDSSAFFSFREFKQESGVHCAYNWAREVQRVAFEEYELNGIENEEFESNLLKLDTAHGESVEPWEALTPVQLVDMTVHCQKFREYLYTLP